ncbi:unnamed protein product [Rotaria sp. Silwood2]|nr:unnamed protein product [Rotaria sp. Silwood2]
MMKVFLFILLFIQTIYSLELKKLSTCQTALGMQSGSIPDSAVSVSSSYDSNTVGSKASRVRTEQYGGAWCPLNQINSIPNEWLEIDFGNLTYLTQVETQGRFDNGRGKEYTDYYILMYTRLDNIKNNEALWIEYRLKNENTNSTWIRANQNTYMGEIRQLNPPIVAKRLRFYPVSKQMRTICMRVEVYGCLFSDGIVSYSMPQGRIDVNSFGDDTYDGKYISSTNMLINGLGQLSDGITGSEEISIIDEHQPWIGWSNETSTYITIKFQFDSLRQINRVTIHANNLFSKEILIFKTAIISFSKVDDEKHYSNIIIYQHNRDDIFEIARPILIELNNHIAKFVRLDLYFDSKWLLISEITFDSQIYNEKIEKNNEIKEKILKKSLNIDNDLPKHYREIQKTTILMNSSAKISPVITIELSLAFFIGALLVITILLIVSLIWILQRKKKLQFQKLTEKPCNNSSCCTYPTLQIREFHDLNAPIESAIDDREYAMPDVNFYSTLSHKYNLTSPRLFRALTINPNNMNSYPTLQPISHCCFHQQQYLPMHQQSPMLFSQVEESPPVEAPCGNSLMITMNIIMDNKQVSIKEINSDDLICIENIGHGLVGSIHLAELQVTNNDNEIKKQNVIIKSLNDNADVKQKALFWKEIELLSILNNSNVCTLLGILNSQRTVAVFEYYSLDLYQYLRQQLIPLDNCSASSFLLSLACQIASAMKYLSSLQIIHRDLAVRNCLISPTDHQLHLTDIAMAKSEYANDYARVGPHQSRIAIRWSAWESIFLNKFSLKSDVWSFGVTLYELYTYARQRPFHTLTNEQLVQQFACLTQTELSSPCLVRNNLHLPQPELCSKEIYDMMCECWQRDCQHRPSFADIHTFLLGKASGSVSLALPEL